MRIEDTISKKSARYFYDLAAKQPTDSSLRVYYWSLASMIDYYSDLPSKMRKDIKSLRYFAWLETEGGLQ